MNKNKTTKIRLFGVRTCNFSVMYYCKNSLSEILTGHGISLIKRRVCQEFDNLRKFYFSQASFISLQFIFICLRYFCSCFFLYAGYLSRYAPRRSEYQAFATALTLGAIHSTKIPTGPTGKSGPPQKVDPFFRNFPVGPNRSIESWTEISGNLG